jgi:hypothetical protein
MKKAVLLFIFGLIIFAVLASIYGISFEELIHGISVFLSDVFVIVKEFVMSIIDSIKSIDVKGILS